MIRIEKVQLTKGRKDLLHVASDHQTSSEDEDDNNIFRYTRGNFNPKIHEFDNSETQIQPEFGVDEQTKPYEILQKFLTQDIMQEMVNQTNLFTIQVKQRNPTAFSKWKPVLNRRCGVSYPCA
jgi:hypothetical protein